MNLEELVNKIQEITLNSPIINTFVYDDAEAIDEAHATDYPLLLQSSVEDLVNIRSNRQNYNIEFYLLDTYFQDDPKNLRQKYSDLEKEGILIIKELLEENDVASKGEIIINRSVDAHNDALCLVKFNFSVEVINCNDLLKQPTGLIATYASTTSLDLTWSDRSAEDSFELYRSLDNINFSILTTLSADVSYYTDSGLELDTSYYYKVRALSSNNRSAFSSVAIGSTVTPITPATPPILENLAVYYNPDEEVYSDLGTTLAVDGDNIRQMNDQSGNSNTLSQSTASIQPIYDTTTFSGGLASIKSINDSLIPTSELDFDNSTSWTFYHVYKKASNANIYYWFRGAVGGYPRTEHRTTLFQIRDDSGSGRFVNYTDNTDIKIMAITVDRSSGEFKMYINGSYIGVSAASVTNWTVTIGQLYANGNAIMNVGNVLFYTDAHDATQVEEVSDWLNEKYIIY